MRGTKVDWLPDAWRRFGLLDLATLRDIERKTRDDPEWAESQEHLLFEAIQAFFHRRTTLSDEEVSAFIAAHEQCSEIAFGDSPLYELVRFNGLSVEQLQALAENPRFQETSLRRLVARKLLIRSIVKDGLSEQLFERVVELRDAASQRFILKHCELTEKQLLVLVEVGANKAVRSLARVSLKRQR